MTTRHLLSLQSGDTQAQALEIPGYLFAAKSAGSLPPLLRDLASLEVLSDPSVVFKICQVMCRKWRLRTEASLAERSLSSIVNDERIAPSALQ
jgi:hypothetical protein